MKRVYTARHPTDAHLLADLLEAEGIPVATRSADYGWRSWIPLLEPPSVWIVEDSDLERAVKFVEEYSRRESPERGSTWQCSTCGEHVEKQFDACWKCKSPDADDASVDPDDVTPFERLESSPISSMKSGKKRHGCLVAWLGFLVLLGASGMFESCELLLAPDLVPQPTWLLWLYLVMDVLSLVFAMAILKWRRWGFFGFVGYYMFYAVTGLIFVPVSAIVSLSLLAALYGILQFADGSKTGWSQLE